MKHVTERNTLQYVSETLIWQSGGEWPQVTFSSYVHHGVGIFKKIHWQLVTNLIVIQIWNFQSFSKYIHSTLIPQCYGLKGGNIRLMKPNAYRYQHYCYITEMPQPTITSIALNTCMLTELFKPIFNGSQSYFTTKSLLLHMPLIHGFV